ncbi:MAG: dihydrofolate reductase family protein [Coriobacteriia bacterium]|nr:dihydrofolate reductase family protein [Coriobacteriia bacterium]
MRPVVLYIATSLDGFIAREDGSIEFLDPWADGDYGYDRFYAGVDTLLIGGNTYRQALEFEEWPYDGKRVIVFTRHIPADGDERVEFVTNDVAGFTRRLRAEDGKTIWLVGGAQIIGTLIDADLVDELIVSLVPIILGAGVPLVWPGERDVPLELVSSVDADGGVVQMRYRVKHRPAAEPAEDEIEVD